jgi:nitrate/nitrite-specific signal transduction histidine kinase
MAYAYLDANLALLEAFSAGFAPIEQEPVIQEIPCELDSSWKQFEQELGNFKLKLKKESVSLTSKMGLLDELNRNIKASKMIADHITSDDLKAKLLSIVDNYESEEAPRPWLNNVGKSKGKLRR